MIVWSGFGFLTVLFAILGAGLGAVLQPVLDGSGLGLPGMTALAIGLVIAAGVNWVVGQKLNSGTGREMIDAKTGQRVVFRRRHTLFWIPMQYFSVVMLIVAVLAVVGLLDTPGSAGPAGGQPA